jgi:hypothetical protein
VPWSSRFLPDIGIGASVASLAVDAVSSEHSKRAYPGKPRRLFQLELSSFALLGLMDAVSKLGRRFGRKTNAVANRRSKLAIDFVIGLNLSSRF